MPSSPFDHRSRPPSRSIAGFFGHELSLLASLIVASSVALSGCVSKGDTVVKPSDGAAGAAPSSTAPSSKGGASSQGGSSAGGSGQGGDPCAAPASLEVFEECKAMQGGAGGGGGGVPEICQPGKVQWCGRGPAEAVAESNACQVCLAASCCDQLVACGTDRGVDRWEGTTPAEDMLWACVLAHCDEPCRGKPAHKPCQGDCGAAMALMPEGYWIDKTEVTRDQYAVFLQATAGGAEVGGQPFWCVVGEYDDLNCEDQVAPGRVANGTFAPDVTCETEASQRGMLNTDGKSPVVCVDWCDADAYCRWAGKRLCGPIGGGAPGSIGEGQNPLRSEWESACSAHGAQKHPYGDSFDSDACNADDQLCGEGKPAVVATFAGCITGGDRAGVADLIGNVAEWDVYGFRGGSRWGCGYGVPGCSVDVDWPYGKSNPNNNDDRWAGCSGWATATVGFRCCKDQ